MGNVTHAMAAALLHRGVRCCFNQLAIPDTFELLTVGNQNHVLILLLRYAFVKSTLDEKLKPVDASKLKVSGLRLRCLVNVHGTLISGSATEPN